MGNNVHWPLDDVDGEVDVGVVVGAEGGVGCFLGVGNEEVAVEVLDEGV